MIYGIAYRVLNDMIAEHSCAISFNDIITEDNITGKFGNSSLTMWFSTQPHNAARCKFSKTPKGIRNGEEAFYEDKIRYKHSGDKVKYDNPDTGDSKLNKNIAAAAIRYEQPMRLLKQDKDFEPAILEDLIRDDFGKMESKKVKKISGKVEVTKLKDGSYEMHEVE